MGRGLLLGYLHVLKGLFHEDFAVLGQFRAKNINLLPLDIHKMIL